jgi:hypothetical protein
MLMELLLAITKDWRRLLLLKEERISLLSKIFAFYPKDLEELRVSEMLGVPSFMKIDEKRWCQASVLKGGRSTRSRLLPRRKDRKKQEGSETKNKKEVLKSVCEKREERVYLDRAAGGDSDYRHLGSYPVPRLFKSEGAGSKVRLPIKPKTNRDGVDDVYSRLG